jgi:hypothetical protein
MPWLKHPEKNLGLLSWSPLFTYSWNKKLFNWVLAAWNLSRPLFCIIHVWLVFDERANKVCPGEVAQGKIGNCYLRA